jgi:EAL domain-containing protein (putative c-di-GMP-specific phosphodiesterase class I)
VPQSKSKLSVLLIDDDSFSVELALGILKRNGFEITEMANSGKAALEMLTMEGASYDIVILDLQMPEMDGIEFMGHLSNSGFVGGLVLLSGEDKRMLETALGLAKSHRLNILGALPKPLQPTLLWDMLSKFEPSSRASNSYLPQETITEEELIQGIQGSTENYPMLVFQPKVCIRSGEITSVETLARWWNADRGVLGPATFIPLAEETGLIDDLSFVIYRKAVIQLANWSKQGINMLCAVNISVNSFSKKAFCDYLVEVASEHGVQSNQITLEITESQTMAMAVDCLQALMGMRLKRFCLSIDDFGTGSSSMAQLKNIPFTELKIDRAFVNGATHDASARAILETSIELAKKLNMQIVAEGAETREDWNLVEELGCDYVQGFYCARPMGNADFEQFLQSWSGPH